MVATHIRIQNGNRDQPRPRSTRPSGPLVSPVGRAAVPGIPSMPGIPAIPAWALPASRGGWAWAVALPPGVPTGPMVPMIVLPRPECSPPVWSQAISNQVSRQTARAGYSGCRRTAPEYPARTDLTVKEPAAETIPAVEGPWVEVDLAVEDTDP